MQAPRSQLLFLSAAIMICASACATQDVTEPRAIGNTGARSALIENTWESKAPRLTPSSSGFSALIGGKVYSVGGAAPHINNEQATLQVYDVATNTWSHAAAPAQTNSWTATESGGKIYLFSGYFQGQINTNTQIYDPALNTWSAGTPIPRHHLLGVAGVMNGRIYVAGGSTGFQYEHTTDVYDPVSGAWTTAAGMGVPRTFVSGAVLDGKLYVVGGYTEASGFDEVATLEVYDPAMDAWTLKAPMPTARASAATVAYAGKLYVIGGLALAIPEQPEAYTNVVEIYDPVTDTWTTGTPIRTRLVAPQAVVATETLFVIAGFESPNSVTTNDALRLTPLNPTTIAQCLKAGWQAYGFRNEGQCIRFVQTGKDSRVGG